MADPARSHQHFGGVCGICGTETPPDPPPLVSRWDTVGYVIVTPEGLTPIDHREA